MKRVTVMTCLVILTMVLSAGSVSAGDAGSRARSLFQPIDAEVRAYLASPTESKAPEALDALTNELLTKYDENLEAMMQALREWDPDLPVLTGRAREGFKYTAVREHIHEVWQEMMKPQDVRKIEIRTLRRSGSYTNNGITYAQLYYAPQSGHYPINHWVQVYDDIHGGQGTDDAGLGFNINGDNDLYKLVIYYHVGDRVTYELWFRDEDHPDPGWDQWWDAQRLNQYGRIEDVESFYIEDNVIHFDNIWSNDKTFAFPIGQHGTQTRDYTDTIYVSNVWNHAMDINDENPGLGKVWLQFP